MPQHNYKPERKRAQAIAEINLQRQLAECERALQVANDALVVADRNAVAAEEHLAEILKTAEIGRTSHQLTHTRAALQRIYELCVGRRSR